MTAIAATIAPAARVVPQDTGGAPTQAEPGHKSSPPAAERGLRHDWLPLLAILLLGLGGAVFLRLVVLERIAGLEDALEARPPLAVVDYTTIQDALAAGATPAELQPAFAAIKERAGALGEQGFLVINRAALESVPPRLVLPAAPVLLAPRAPAPPWPDAPASFGAAPPAQAGPAVPLLAGRLAPPTAPGAPPAAAPDTAMSDAEAAALLRALIAGQAGARP